MYNNYVHVHVIMRQYPNNPNVPDRLLEGKVDRDSPEVLFGWVW